MKRKHDYDSTDKNAEDQSKLGHIKYNTNHDFYTENT
jgi:hypothetical protein